MKSKLLSPFKIPLVHNFEKHDGIRLVEQIKEKGNSLSISCRNWEGYGNSDAVVHLAHDGQNLYLLFVCVEMNVKAEVVDDLGPVASDSCVEFFVSPDAESTRYWNFEFNAIGRKNVSTRIDRNNPRRLTPSELDSIITYPSLGTEPIGHREGEIPWELAVVIPLSLLGLVYEGAPLNVKGNFYKCAGRTANAHYLSWAPINTLKPDFHRPEFFKNIVLSD